MKTRIAFGTFAAVWIVVIALGIFVWLRHSQRIVLPDGTKLTLAAVTYGKHHEFPGLKIARARFNTATDVLCVWIREDFTNASPGDYTACALDKSGAFCAGHASVQRYPAGKGEDIACLRLNVFPRRDGQIRLQIEADDSQGGTRLMNDEFVVTFPAQKSSAEWQPQPLPATEGDGDLTVTLTKLVYGVSFQHPKNTVTSDPMDKAVQAVFRVEQNGVIATNWRPGRIESWDATGNHSFSGPRKNRRDGDEDVLIYQWGLSPDEPAWKLRAEFVRTSGFAPDELWTVAGIPVSTNAVSRRNRRSDLTGAFASKKTGDSTVAVFPAGPGDNPGQVRLHVSVDPPPSEDLNFTLVEMTDDGGKKIRPVNLSRIGGNFNYTFRDGGTKTLAATFALQGGRFVEFTVKPSKQ
jgi:hypothetical protein